jgi:glycosyltransferase involved in cell wall biosynthesis
VTLHGLYAFNDGISITDRVKKIEKDFLKYAKANNIPITVISTGVRLTILNFLGLKDSKNFSVITNSFNLIIDNKKEEINLRKKYKIKSNSKIMISVGNIGRRKNQEQIIRAYSMLPISVKENLVILFFGYDTTDSKFKSKLLSSVSVSNLKYCGDIPKNDLSGVYSQADYVILASISEGFGLSIIEGFSFGVPCITFSDLDAVLDLFDEKSMYLVENRSDEALAKGIEAFVNIEWDKNEIIKHSQKFTIEKMALNYIDVFVQVIEKS